MIKIESKIEPKDTDSDTGISTVDLSIAIEAFYEEDLKVLDLILEMLVGGYPLQVGFNSTNRLIISARDMEVKL